MMKPLSGPIFAIVTPFQANSEIDFTALADYLSFLQEKGVQILLVNGTTGEFPSLTLQERMEVVEHCRQKFSGIVLNHVSSCCLADCRKLMAHSTNHADGLVILPPYYYAHTSELGLWSFFQEILSYSKLPVYLYHFPKHTQNAITPNLVQKLLKDHPNLVGIKDSEANLDQSVKFKTFQKGTFQVFVGGDRVALEVLKRGLDGSVTGGGNPFPEFLLALFRDFQTGNVTAAETSQSHLDKWSQFRKQNNLGEIPLTKIALRTRLPNFPTFVRPPLLKLDATRTAEVEAFVRQQILPLVGLK